MEKDTVRCNNCFWIGAEDELETFVDLETETVGKEVHYLRGCPECGTDEYLMDI